MRGAVAFLGSWLTWLMGLSLALDLANTVIAPEEGTDTTFAARFFLQCLLHTGRDDQSGYDIAHCFARPLKRGHAHLSIRVRLAPQPHFHHAVGPCIAPRRRQRC